MRRYDKRVLAAVGAVAIAALVVGLAMVRGDDADTIVATAAVAGAVDVPDDAVDTAGRSGDRLDAAEAADCEDPDEGCDGGEGDEIIDDMDGDGVVDESDNCPDLANPDQLDSDGDTAGDACDEPEEAAAEPEESTSTPTPVPTPTAVSPTPTPAPESDDGASPGVTPQTVSGEACILYLHGAGTSNAGYVENFDEGILRLVPQSPNPEWPHFWLYDGAYLEYTDSDEPFLELVAFLTAELDASNCGPVMLHGASNGAGFAAKLYCRGIDFGGRLWSVIVDDPVPDAGVVGCSPSGTVERSLFTHSAEIARDAALFEDNRCTQSPTLPWPWYCEDDIGFDVAEYESHIGQRSYLGREDHIGVNTAEFDFWAINLGWWYEFDPERFPQFAGR